MTTHIILDDGRPRKAIRCLRCGSTSYQPVDVRERFCAWCCMFHDAPDDLKPHGPNVLPDRVKLTDDRQ
jgi:hypothetical protein